MQFVLWERAENLTQDDEDDTDSVISLMADFISKNSFKLTVEPITMQITSMHEETFYTQGQLFNWCK